LTSALSVLVTVTMETIEGNIFNKKKERWSDAQQQQHKQFLNTLNLMSRILKFAEHLSMNNVLKKGSGHLAMRKPSRVHIYSPRRVGG
jgi:hypothetical protein